MLTRKEFYTDFKFVDVGLQKFSEKKPQEKKSLKTVQIQKKLKI
jgi:hypothetical protein